MDKIVVQLMQNRESLDFALESGRMGTWDINLETGRISCSQEMLDLWGIKLEEFKNKRSLLQSKVHPEDIDKMKAAINDAIQNRSIYELEYRITPTPGKELWVLSRGRCTFAPHSKNPIHFAGIVYDITERVKNEQKLIRALKARDEFFAVASHELRTPLTCMQLQLQVMEWQIKQMSPEAPSFNLLQLGLKKQYEHLSRISRIVDNILDESQISEGNLLMQRELFDLSEMVSKVLTQFKLTADLAGVEIKFKTSQKVMGTWDRFRLEQVLLNLLMNAIRYGNKKPIQIEVTKTDDHAVMVVKDRGIGIRLEDQVRVFQRFERVNKDKEMNGMGLGLFISNNIVLALGGQILLKSELGKGSEFSVVIPCSLSTR